MKYLIIYLFLLLSVNVYSQFSLMFNDTLKPFGPGGYDFACIAQDDSFYYAVGGVNNNQPLWDNMIVKFDKSFNVVKKRKFIDTIWYNANYPYNTISVTDKKLVFCTQQSKNQMSIIYGKIIALNKHTLDTLWTKVIEHPDTAYVNLPNAVVFSDLTAIKQTPDGGYILTGNYNLQCSGANLRSFLLKIDSVGNVQWRRTYNQYYTFFDIEVASDSGYFVPCTINGSSLILVKFDKNGLYQWKTIVNPNTNPSYPMDVTLYANYAIVSSVFWYDISNSLRAITVAKVDINNHNTIWKKNYYLYRTVECIGIHQAMGVETLLDGSIIVNGTVEKYGVDKSAFILKLNSNGDSLWTKTYNFSTSSTAQGQLNDLMLADDGGFIGVGYFYNFSTSSAAWMFKTDKNGVVGWESPKAKAQSEKCKVWPNPASNYTTLSFSKPVIKDSKLIIFNSLGQKVKTISLQKQQQKIEVSLQGFKAGVYYFELRTNNKIIGTGKFIKE